MILVGIFFSNHTKLYYAHFIDFSRLVGYCSETQDVATPVSFMLELCLLSHPTS